MVMFGDVHVAPPSVSDAGGLDSVTSAVGFASSSLLSGGGGSASLQGSRIVVPFMHVGSAHPSLVVPLADILAGVSKEACSDPSSVGGGMCVTRREYMFTGSATDSTESNAHFSSLLREHGGRKLFCPIDSIDCGGNYVACPRRRLGGLRRGDTTRQSVDDVHDEGWWAHLLDAEAETEEAARRSLAEAASGLSYSSAHFYVSGEQVDTTLPGTPAEAHPRWAAPLCSSATTTIPPGAGISEVDLAALGLVSLPGRSYGFIVYEVTPL